jgi:hypothetical protein
MTHFASNLTFNLSARYEWFTPYTEQHNHISNLTR